MVRNADIISALGTLAPLEYQESYDNAGLQVAPSAAFSNDEVKGVLVCLDITEQVLDDAIAKGCSVVVSHHPLIFSPLRQVIGATYQQRCVQKALAAGLTLYSAHTNLDNALGGVNHRMASMLGLENIEWLETKSEACGSGVIGTLPEPISEAAFLDFVKSVFKVQCLQHSSLQGRMVRKVALCGGSGSFLLPKAVELGADAFLTGEISYHTFFEAGGILAVAAGHYQSEQYTMNLLAEYLQCKFPELRIEITTINTNPILYR